MPCVTLVKTLRDRVEPELDLVDLVAQWRGGVDKFLTEIADQFCDGSQLFRQVLKRGDFAGIVARLARSQFLS